LPLPLPTAATEGSFASLATRTTRSPPSPARPPTLDLRNPPNSRGCHRRPRPRPSLPTPPHLWPGRRPLQRPRAPPRPRTFHLLAVSIPDARAAVTRLYMLMVLALLGVYARWVANSPLRSSSLPEKPSTGPSAGCSPADHAVPGRARKEAEIIPGLPPARFPPPPPGRARRESCAPATKSVLKLRRQEAARRADGPLRELELVANDLKRKNHLLEKPPAANPRRPADRPRKPGHDVRRHRPTNSNTPLTVPEGGWVEKASTPTPRRTRQDTGGPHAPGRWQRLERLGEQPPRLRPAPRPPQRLRRVQAGPLGPGKPRSSLDSTRDAGFCPDPE